VRQYLPEGEPFCFTYGDGVSDIDMTAQLAFHKAHGKQATITAVSPPGASARWSSRAIWCAASRKSRLVTAA
jgi:NDP-sugar pyrophosphorylase family protein